MGGDSPKKPLVFEAYIWSMVVVIKRGMSRQRIRALMNKLQAPKKRHREVDVYKYLGVLKLEEDPVELQRRWRDEW